MTIKEFAYYSQKHLESQTGNAFKRAHIYELLAASFGYKSYAALYIEAIVIPGPQETKPVSQHSSDIRQRCIELGYQPATADLVSSELPALVAGSCLAVVRLMTLITELHRQLSYWGKYPDPDWGWNDEDDEYDGDDEHDDDLEDMVRNWVDHDDDYDDENEAFSSPLLAELEAAADRGNALAHYALALIYTPDDESNRKTGIDYWYNQEKQGRVLIGVEKEWADQFARKLAKDKKYELHLREAARLGNEDALLDMAERFDNPAFFEKVKSIVHNPLRVAEIAEHLGRMDDVKHWLTIAAEAGDIHSILRLIEEFDHHDLLRCWTWLYFAQLLGTDLTEDDYYAINEDGSDYDDDVGGPCYAAGREGVSITPLSKNQDLIARQAAQELFENLQ